MKASPSTVVHAQDSLGKKPQRLSRIRVILPALVVIIGLAVMLYPVVSTTWNNYQTRQAAADYAKLDQNTPPEVHQQQLESAHHYNKERATGAILDPWAQRLDSTDPDYRAYLGELNTLGAMGRIIIPAINTDLPIYHGTSEESLQRGVGHLYGTDLPVGGEGTHSVLTGHTGLPDNTMFDNLGKLKVGDTFYIQVSGEKLKYEVHSTEVVLPEQTDSLKVQPGQDLVTLITCTPYGINTHRLLVHAHRVPLEPEDNAIFEKTGGLVWQWWMYLLVAAAILLLGWVLWRLVKLLRHNASTSAAQATTASATTAATAKAATTDSTEEEGA